MNISPDDPKLTAYALGELDPAEAEPMERALKDSAELRQAVEEIRRTAEMLKKEFAAEEDFTFSESQKAAIVANVPAENVVSLPPSFWTPLARIGLAAAVVFGGFVVWFATREEYSLSRTSKAPPFKYAQNAESEQAQSLQAKEKQSDERKDFDSSELSESILAITPASPTASSQPAPPVDSTQTGSAKTPAHSAEVSPHFFARTPEPIAATRGSAVQDSTDSGYRGGSVDIPAIPSVQPAQSLAGEDSAQSRALYALRQKESELDAQQGTAKFAKTKGQVSEARGLHNEVALLKASKKSEEAARKAAERPAAMKKRMTTGIPSAIPLASTGQRAEREGFEFRKTFPRDDYFERPKTTSHFDKVTTARYPRYIENGFESVLQNPLSTFSIDVDTASYANVRRFLNEGQMPPRDAVRVEELVNYFVYNYPQPRGDDPFSVNMEVAGCPWDKQHRLLRIGLKGEEIAQDKRPPSNFVFLIDVSGSMSPQNRLPLIKQALRMLVKRMTENDRIAMVVYASSSGVVLESTSCVNKEKILEAIDKLEAGGSTNGGEGIQKAYGLAEENFIKGGVNRVILATDGDFNVGVTSQDELIDLIQRKAKSGVFLSALGVGTDNYKDALLQNLADKGNGNYSYLDSLEEAEKVLIQQMNGTLVTIAKDVKIQIEFNPAQVKSYRLIGYEKRILEAEDFNNDKRDAGEIGAGHTVTALYEIVPANVDEDDELRTAADDLKYQKRAPKEQKPKSDSYFSKENAELLTLKLRYKRPDGNTSKLSEFALSDDGKKFSSASDDFRFAAAVASFGMVLKDSEHKGDFTFEQIGQVAARAKGEDKEGYRAEFLNLVKKAKELSREQ